MIHFISCCLKFLFKVECAPSPLGVEIVLVWDGIKLKLQWSMFTLECTLTKTSNVSKYAHD